MTRKHYVMIAETILARRNETTDALQVDAIRKTAEALGTQFCYDNKNFDYQRFMKACGF